MQVPRPPLAHVLQGASEVVNSGLFRSALRSWWLTLPLGYAAYAMIRQRQKKGELTIPNVFNDLAPMVTVVATIIVLNHTLEQRERMAPPAPQPQKPQLGPIRDAAFTPNDEPVPAIPVGDIL